MHVLAVTFDYPSRRLFEVMSNVPHSKMRASVVQVPSYIISPGRVSLPAFFNQLLGRQPACSQLSEGCG
jgi:hypothetical protein